MKVVGRFVQMVRTSAMQGNDKEGENPKDNLGVQVLTSSGTRNIFVPYVSRCGLAWPLRTGELGERCSFWWRGQVWARSGAARSS